MAIPANILDLDPVDFCGKQVESFAEAFWTQTFMRPALSELLTIIPGVKAKQQVVILGLIGTIGKTMQTVNCVPDTSTAEIPSIEKFFDPGYIEDRFTECWKNLLGKFTVWGLKMGIDKKDLTGTDFADFLEERVLDGLEDSVYRIAWFGEKAAAHIVDGGRFTDTLDLRYVNAINGLWFQLYAIAAANPSQRITIAKNSGATAALQKFTNQDAIDGVVTSYFQDMVDGMDERFEEEDAVFYVTRSIAQQYKRERKKVTGIEMPYIRTEAGWDTLQFDGIEIRVLKFEDRMIKAFQTATGAGAASIRPHRIYLANKENIQLATEEEGSFTKIKAFYVDLTDQYYIDMLYTIDLLVIEDYKVMVAY